MKKILDGRKSKVRAEIRDEDTKFYHRSVIRFCLANRIQSVNLLRNT